MKTYKVAIEEMIVQEFDIEANSAEEALQIAMRKYKAGEFVIEYGEVHHKQIAIEKPDNEYTEWHEF